jgi:hypothetical protein
MQIVVGINFLQIPEVLLPLQIVLILQILLVLKVEERAVVRVSLGPNRGRAEEK